MAELDFLNQDRFFVDLDNGFVEWMYYNPDSVSGGQFVINIFGADDITDALLGTMDADDAFDYIGSSCDQYLADKGTPLFSEAWQRMSAREPFAIGCSHTTLGNLQLAFQARDLINRYCQREFKMDGEYDDLRKIAIGYTTITDAEHHVQGYANLIDHRIEVYLNGNLAMHDQFASLAEMVQCGLPDLEFEDIYSVPDWVVADHERVERENSLATRLVLFMKEYDPVYPEILEPGETDMDMVRKMKAEFGDLDLIPPTIEEIEDVIQSRNLPAAKKTELYALMTDLYHMYAEQMYVPVFDREADVLQRALDTLNLDGLVGYEISFDDEGICLTRGSLTLHNEEIYTYLAGKLTAEDCRQFRDAIFVDYTDLVDLAAHNGVQLDDRLRTPPVGRIEFLDNKGFPVEAFEYQTEADLLGVLKEELNCGAPVGVVLYRDGDGKTISRDFLNELDTLPKYVSVGDAPMLPLHVERSERGDAR